MQTYKVIINEVSSKTISSIDELTQELETMQSTEDMYMAFIPIPNFNDLDSLDVIKLSEIKGIFKKRLVPEYHLHLYCKYASGKMGIYQHIVSSFNEVNEILSNLITHQKLPNIPAWKLTRIDENGRLIPYKRFRKSDPNWYK